LYENPDFAIHGLGNDRIIRNWCRVPTIEFWDKVDVWNAIKRECSAVGNGLHIIGKEYVCDDITLSQVVYRQAVTKFHWSMPI